MNTIGLGGPSKNISFKVTKQFRRLGEGCNISALKMEPVGYCFRAGLKAVVAEDWLCLLEKLSYP